MCSYNRVNGTPACDNKAMLGDDGLLRSNGFKGAIISDWEATHDSTADNVKAGLDMEMPGGTVYGHDNLTNAVNSGDISEEARLFFRRMQRLDSNSKTVLDVKYYGQPHPSTVLHAWSRRGMSDCFGAYR